MFYGGFATRWDSVKPVFLEAGLRGAASIVFAVLAVNQAKPDNDIFNLVFMLVLLSMSFQGSLLPWISKKLDMLDHHSNVLKTFNDFVDDETVLGKVEIKAGSEWLGKSIILMIKRGDERIIPNGQTILQSGDQLVILDLDD